MKGMSERRLGRLLFKVALGVAGFLAGGYAGFWIVAFGADAIIPVPDHPLTEPGAGMGPAFAGLFVGIPIGAFIGCILAVMYADTVAAKIVDLVSRLRKR
jgi:hypothetical protein